MKHPLIWLIKLYQKTLSRILPPSCRFTPSCSQYAVIAIGRFGVFKGGFMAFWRILRCNPFSAGGCDPVPEKKEAARGCVIPRANRKKDKRENKEKTR